MKIKVKRAPKPPEEPPAEATGCQHPTYRPDMDGPWKEFFCDTCGEQLKKGELSGRTNLGLKFPQ